MIFLKINFIVGILYLVLSTLSTIAIAHDFKLKYPDLKAPKTSLAATLLSVIRNVVVALIPLFNLLLCFSFIFSYESIKDKAMNKMYNKFSKGENNVTHVSETSER